MHKLRVETYGGASWLNEFSVLTGLSSRYWAACSSSPDHQPARCARRLPAGLRRCGYRNVAVHPMLRVYLAIGKFFEAIGFHKMLDAEDQRAESAVERDHFYYTSALAEMERHLKASSQPLFTFIETMATHGPYDYVYMPEVDVPGGGPSTSRDMHEYLRGCMSHQDYAFCAPSCAGASRASSHDRPVRATISRSHAAAAWLPRGRVDRGCQQSGNQGAHDLTPSRGAFRPPPRPIWRPSISPIWARSCSMRPACRSPTSTASASV